MAKTSKHKEPAEKRSPYRRVRALLNRVLLVEQMDKPHKATIVLVRPGVLFAKFPSGRYTLFTQEGGVTIFGAFGGGVNARAFDALIGLYMLGDITRAEHAATCEVLDRLDKRKAATAHLSNLRYQAKSAGFDLVPRKR